MKIDINLDNYLAKPNKTIKQHNDDLLKQLDILYDLGYVKNEKLYNLLTKACLYHDIGKVNVEFQKRVQPNIKLKFNDETEICHNVLSFCFIDKNDFEDEKDFMNVSHAVLHHHNYGNVFDIFNEKSDLINHLLEPFNTKKPKGSVIRKFCTKDIVYDHNSILIKGFLHKCDYSASADYQVEYKNDFLLDSLDNLNFKWNNVQQFCIENRENNIIAIAATGAGKTEAGLLWLGNNKSFFILPVRTAINAMYDRIKKDILKNKNIEERLSVLHSSSLDFYNKDKKDNKSFEDVNNSTDVDAIEYENRGKRLSIPLNVSTMDQLFDFVFKYDGFELKLATLSYSKIVIDEIQMYSSDLLAYLVYGIDKIIEMGGKVAIVTATLPPFIYDLLDKDKNKYQRQDFITDDTTQKARHNVKVLENEIDEQDIIDKYVENNELGYSNKILVVCNTVRKAQEMYDKLKQSDIFEENELNILHSRFIKKERLVKEQQICKFGQTYRDGKLDNQKGIWISTSLVEASLDIDFDYLFTELQDLSSLFQRFGRVNRKGAKNTDTYNCFVYTVINTNLLKKSISSDKGFIDVEIFELSKQALQDVDGLLSENEKLQLINTYLTTENLNDSSYLYNYRQTYKQIENLDPYEEDKKNIKLRNILSESIIPSDLYFNDKDEIDDLVCKYNNCLHDISTLRKSNDILSSACQGKLRELELKKNYLFSKINDFTVDIENRVIYRIIYNKNSDRFNDLVLGDKKRFKVIDCTYDEKGFTEKNTKDKKESTAFV